MRYKVGDAVTYTSGAVQLFGVVISVDGKFMNVTWKDITHPDHRFIDTQCVTDPMIRKLSKLEKSMK